MNIEYTAISEITNCDIDCLDEIVVTTTCDLNLRVDGVVSVLAKGSKILMSKYKAEKFIADGTCVI